MRKLSIWLTSWLFAALTASSVPAQVYPLTGGRFEQWSSRQDRTLQGFLQERVPVDSGYFVTGPLDPTANRARVRIICPGWRELNKLASRMSEDPAIQVETEDTALAILKVSMAGREARVILLTYASLRYTIWQSDIDRQHAPELKQLTDGTWQSYQNAVAAYLLNREAGVASEPPVATEWDLNADLDLYAPQPDYVIQGYANYKAFLREHADIDTDFARGILGFIPTDSLLDAFKLNAPPVAFPNKEQAALQHEFKKFFERGGDVRVMRTLTAESFASLTAGEYFFGMNVAGQIRFGRELLREEVQRIEAETGRKAPRANHAYLFPGEPLLTAGAFWIEADPEPRLAEVTAGSGHYFYSNIQPTIREDIAERSDEYIWTLGHFFRALDSLGIAYDDVLIRKF